MVIMSSFCLLEQVLGSKVRGSVICMLKESLEKEKYGVRKLYVFPFGI